MNIHENARLTPCRREEMAIAVISGRLSQIQAGRVFGVSAKIVARWTDRCRTGGRAAMGDRSVLGTSVSSLNRSQGSIRPQAGQWVLSNYPPRIAWSYRSDAPL